MFRLLLRMMGMRAATKAIAGTGGRPPLLDFRTGFALFRDGRVPAPTKLLALMLGGAATALMVALEVPVEAVIGFVLNIPGVGLDLAVDGLEMVAGPLLFGALFLTRLAPKAIEEA
jgi:hypothetical protein